MNGIIENKRKIYKGKNIKRNEFRRERKREGKRNRSGERKKRKYIM